MKLFPWRRKAKPVSTARPLPPRYLSYQCAVMQGVGGRDYQEDSWTIVNADDVSKIRTKGLLAVVADGMGGLSNGAFASQTGIQILTEDFSEMQPAKNLEQQLRDSVYHAAKTVYSHLNGTGGSTIISVLLHNEALHYAGMGDSFLYLLRQGKLIRINREQNMLHLRMQEFIRQGTVDIGVIPGISQPKAVTSFLGIDKIEDIDWLKRSLPLQSHDVILLCSDGVAGVLTEPEIIACLSIPNASEATRSLQNCVLSKGLPNQDNFTAIVIRCEK